jgi:hypothetical protein
MSQEAKQLTINFLMAGMLVTLIAGVQIKETPIVHAQNNEVVISSPTPVLNDVTVSHKEVVEDTPENYIKEVFGKDSNKAFLLLKGNGEKGGCAENRNLDPKAVNDNRTWGGVGRDVNIFQVNDVYHPVVELNLENDWKANIRYAKKMFDNDGETFSKRWTCGKYYNKLGYTI